MANDTSALDPEELGDVDEDLFDDDDDLDDLEFDSDDDDDDDVDSNEEPNI
jgi:ribonuclease E